jgi:hypothetical protein
MLTRIEDWILFILQRRCKHPDGMVAADIAEGICERAVRYCRRCGAVRLETHWSLDESPWRLPNPYLWRRNPK